MDEEIKTSFLKNMNYTFLLKHVTA